MPAAPQRKRESYLSPGDLHWYTENTDQPPLKGGLVFLPGRGNTGYSMVRTYTRVFDLSNIALFAVTPRLDKGWYPSPNSPIDQAEAVSGQPNAARLVEFILAKIEKNHGLAREKIIIVGFSMGAVTAVQFAARTKKVAAAVVSHSGAILEPHNLPKATHEMPVIINHSLDDCCFDWYERYDPMKKSLRKQGYKTYCVEREEGNHQILPWDVSCLEPVLLQTYEKTVQYDSYQ